MKSFAGLLFTTRVAVVLLLIGVFFVAGSNAQDHVTREINVQALASDSFERYASHLNDDAQEWTSGNRRGE